MATNRSHENDRVPRNFLYLIDILTEIFLIVRSLMIMRQHISLLQTTQIEIFIEILFTFLFHFSKKVQLLFFLTAISLFQNTKKTLFLSILHFACIHSVHLRAIRCWYFLNEKQLQLFVSSVENFVILTRVN